MILKSLTTLLGIIFVEVSIAQTGSQVTKIDPEKYKVISTDRLDGRYVSTRGAVQYMMRNQQPQLAFDPKFSKNEFIEWQSKVRIKLQELMKFPFVPPQPHPKFLSKVKRDGYTIEKWEIYPQPGSVVPFLLLIPEGVTSKTPGPAVLCLPGTSRSKESLAGESELFPVYAFEHFNEINRMAMFYVRQGIVAVAVDNPGYVETSDLEKYTGKKIYDVGTLTQYLINMDWHYMGLAVFQSQQILKWMRARDFIDPTKIAVSGHSLGAWMAAYLAVLNPDIYAAVLNQVIYSWHMAAKVRTKPDSTGVRPPSFGLFYVIPGWYKWFDNPDLVASLAPRSLLFSEGVPERDYELIQKAYQIMDAKDKVTLFNYPKYRNPKARYYDYLPEGLDNNEFWKYINTDPPDHYFKADAAVPWLKNVLMIK